MEARRVTLHSSMHIQTESSLDHSKHLTRNTQEALKPNFTTQFGSNQDTILLNEGMGGGGNKMEFEDDHSQDYQKSPLFKPDQLSSRMN
jgi:hypothetical protein